MRPSICPPATCIPTCRAWLVEVMANSDNVLRGGLTPKHVDAPELLRMLDFTPTTEAALRPESPGTEWNSSITRRRRSSQCRCSVSTAARPRDRRARLSRTADPVVHGRLDGGARQVQRADAGVRSGHLGVDGPIRLVAPHPTKLVRGLWSATNRATLVASFTHRPPIPLKRRAPFAAGRSRPAAASTRPHRLSKASPCLPVRRGP